MSSFAYFTALLAAFVGGWLCGAAVDFYCERHAWTSRLAVAACTMVVVGWAGLAVQSDLLIASCVLGIALVVLAAIDIRVMLLPNVITLPLILGGVLLSAWLDDPSAINRLAGAAAGYVAFAALGALYRGLRGRDGLGLGDAKLMAAAGAWLGWAALPSVLLLGCIAGLAWALLRLLRGRESWHQPLPFGAPLAAAFWLVWLYGPFPA